MLFPSPSVPACALFVLTHACVKFSAMYIPQFGYTRENGAFSRIGISVPISISSSSQQSCQCHSCHQFHPSYIIHHSALHQFIGLLIHHHSSSHHSSSTLLLSACNIAFHMTSVAVHHHSSSSAASLHELLSVFTALLTIMQRQLQCMHGMLRCVRLIGQTTTRLIGQTTAAKRVTVLWDTCVDPKVVG